MTQNTTLPTSISPVLRRTLELARDDPRNQADLCARAGVSRKTMFAWRSRGAATLGGLEAMLGAMGYRLEVVPIEDVARQRSTPKPRSDTPVARTKRQASDDVSPEDLKAFLGR